MENKRGLDEFRSSYGFSLEEEDVSDDEEWLTSRPSASNCSRQSAIFPLPKKQRIDTSFSKSDQQNVSLSAAVKSSIQSDSCLGHSRTIIHVDIDCFYAQVEMIRNPELRNLPLGVQQKHIVVTCNYVARKRGVKKLSFVSDAKKKCPDLVLVNGEDLTVYREFSGKIHLLLTREFTPMVERLGMDENFLDVTELVTSRLQSTPCEERPFSGGVYSRSSDAKNTEVICPGVGGGGVYNRGSDANNTKVMCPGGGGKGVYPTKFYTGTLHPRSKLLPFYIPFLTEKVPLSYTSTENGTPFINLP